MRIKMRPAVSALVEIAILFLPAIPAYLWMWPAVEKAGLFYPVQSLVYVYVLLGGLFIGLRRWSRQALGFNSRGILMGIVCGSVLIAELLLLHISLGKAVQIKDFSLLRFAWEAIFYIALVGLVEEFIFRGLVYRALHDIRGSALAILGSSVGFALWHANRMGLLLVGPFLIGIIFALIRWRGGGIVGLIIIHGLYDLFAAQLRVPITVESLAQVLSLPIANPYALLAGDLLLIALIVYLWKVHPRLRPPVE